MEKIVRLLKFCFSSGGRTYRYSLTKSLATLIPHARFKEICNSSSNSKELFYTSAMTLKVDEERLLRALSAMWNIDIVKRIPHVDISLLPSSCNLEELRKVSIAPLCEGGKIYEYATIDPQSVGDLVRQHKLPIVPVSIASPELIQSALAEIANEESKKRQEEIKNNISYAEPIIREVVNQAIMKGSDEVVLLEETEGVLRYEASRKGKLVAKGKIASVMKDPLATWFIQHEADKISFDLDSGLTTVHVVHGLGREIGILRFQDAAKEVNQPQIFEKTVDGSQERLLSGIMIEVETSQTTNEIPALKSDEKSLPRILIVEDNPTLSRVLQRLLDTEGFQSVAIPHGGVGLEMIEHDGAFDAILCDLHMPKVDGHLFIKKVRQASQKIPIIVLTSDSDPESHLQALEVGADTYLTKDVDPKVLIAHIKRRVSATNKSGEGVVDEDFEITREARVTQ